MTEREIAAHAYRHADFRYWFHLPCCDSDVGVLEEAKRFECPICGKGYIRGIVGETLEPKP